jgi:glycosyltransferase involved in cell wall biosynthesis
MKTAIIFPGYNQKVAELEHAPFKLLASISELGTIYHFYRGNLNKDVYHYDIHHRCIGKSRSKLGLAFDYSIRLFRFLKKYQITLIYCFDADIAFYVIWAAKIYRIPLILQVGIDWSAYLQKTPSRSKRQAKNIMRRKAVREATSVVALAHHLVKHIEPFGKTPTVLYPYIDLKDYHFEERKKRKGVKEILFIGRLVPVKGARHLIDSLPFILKQRDDFHLTIVGGSPTNRRTDETYLRQQIDKNNLSDKVTLVGQIPHSRVKDYLQKADLIVMPSETEGFHFTLLEAWASGAPVLASDIPFHREVIENSVGRICQLSPESIAKGVLEFLNMEEEKLFKMRLASRKKVEKLSTISIKLWREFFKEQKDTITNLN